MQDDFKNNLEIYKILIDIFKHNNTRTVDSSRLCLTANSLIMVGIFGVITFAFKDVFSKTDNWYLIIPNIIICYVIICVLSSLGKKILNQSNISLKRVSKDTEFRVFQLREIEYKLSKENNILISPFREGYWFMRKGLKTYEIPSTNYECPENLLNIPEPLPPTKGISIDLVIINNSFLIIYNVILIYPMILCVWFKVIYPLIKRLRFILDPDTSVINVYLNRIKEDKRLRLGIIDIENR